MLTKVSHKILLFWVNKKRKSVKREGDNPHALRTTYMEMSTNTVLVEIKEIQTQDLSIYYRPKALPLDYLSYAYILFTSMIYILPLSKAKTFAVVLVYTF